MWILFYVNTFFFLYNVPVLPWRAMCLELGDNCCRNEWLTCWLAVGRCRGARSVASPQNTRADWSSAAWRGRRRLRWRPSSSSSARSCQSVGHSDDAGRMLWAESRAQQSRWSAAWPTRTRSCRRPCWAGGRAGRPARTASSGRRRTSRSRSGCGLDSCLWRYCASANTPEHLACPVS